jgi:hypothetical protein
VPADTYQIYLEAAIRCQGQLSKITRSGSLVARYCLVLEELRLETLIRAENAPAPTTFDQENPTAVEAGIMSEENINSILYAPVTYPDFYSGDLVGFWSGLDISLSQI